MELLKQMFNSLFKFSKKKESSEMERIRDLYLDLMNNSAQIDVLTDNIAKLEAEPELNVDQLEKLYANEFMLHMNNVGIYQDLVTSIEKEPKTLTNQFELKRMEKEAQKMLRVEIIEL